MLTEILKRIAKQETRHIAFYNSQARERLARSKKAQRITRFALERFWGIVGSGVMPVPEVQHLLGYLYGGPAGLAEARKIDAKIDALPGLDGLHLVERQLEKYRIAADPLSCTPSEPFGRAQTREQLGPGQADSGQCR